MLDIQKLANIIYDFRCDCTHTNRRFAKKDEQLADKTKIESYIELVKKIAERIIINYS